MAPHRLSRVLRRQLAYSDGRIAGCSCRLALHRPTTRNPTEFEIWLVARVTWEPVLGKNSTTKADETETPRAVGRYLCYATRIVDARDSEGEYEDLLRESMYVADDAGTGRGGSGGDGGG